MHYCVNCSALLNCLSHDYTNCYICKYVHVNNKTVNQNNLYHIEVLLKSLRSVSPSA